jgi:hypothetical protein
VANPCPRCSQDIPPSESSHDYNCLETLLVHLYQLGVKRGLMGEYEGDFDNQAAEKIGDVLAFAWPWREAALAKQVAAQPAAITLAIQPPRARSEHELDTMIARLLNWQNIGWLGIMAVSGEAAWYDPRVVRRRFSHHYDDAMLVWRLPLMRSLELVQIHRINSTHWEWHVSRKTASGSLESVVREPTAAMAICRAAIKVSGVVRQGQLVG